MITDRNSIILPSFETIPGELKDRGRFIVWRVEYRDGRYTKVPYNPVTWSRSNSIQSTVNFKEAHTAYESGRFDGIGFYCTNGIGFIDLDSCFLPDGSLTEFAREIVETVGAYTEYSPSGSGLRIIYEIPDNVRINKEEYAVKYKKVNKNEPVDIEMYLPDCGLRFGTLTGEGFEEYGNSPVTLQNTQGLETVLDKYLVNPHPRKELSQCGRDPDTDPKDVDFISDEKLIEIIRNSKKGAYFKQLFDTPVDYDATGESENDLRLAGLLCWWTCQDAERTRRLMFKSNRVRGKWTKHRQYMDWTLERALSSMIPGDGFTGEYSNNQ